MSDLIKELETMLQDIRANDEVDDSHPLRRAIEKLQKAERVLAVWDHGGSFQMLGDSIEAYRSAAGGSPEPTKRAAGETES